MAQRSRVMARSDLARSVHGDDDGGRNGRRGMHHGRAQSSGAQAAGSHKSGLVRNSRYSGWDALSADDFSDLAARISATIDWTAGDSAICLARQAGPGPRM